MIFAIIMLLLSCGLMAQEGEPLILREQVQECVRTQDFDRLLNVAKEAEALWIKTHDAASLMPIIEMCRELRTFKLEEKGLAAYRSIIFILLSLDEDDPMRSVALFSKQEMVCLNLAEHAMQYVDKKDEFFRMRGIGTRMAMLFVRRVERRTMSLAQLDLLRKSEPVLPAWGGADVKIAYKDAFAERDRIGSVLYEQSFLPGVRKHRLKMIEEVLVESYSKPPFALDELSEYLLLGGYKKEDRVRILSTIEKYIEKKVPQIDRGEKVRP